MVVTHEAETVRVLIEPELREFQATWIQWTYGYARNTLAMAKYCQAPIFLIATKAIKQGVIH
jgi:hypothetical protein